MNRDKYGTIKVLTFLDRYSCPIRLLEGTGSKEEIDKWLQTQEDAWKLLEKAVKEV